MTRPKFAVVREDPAIELLVAERVSAQRVLVVASGGCTALTLAARGLDVTAFDLSRLQLDRVRAKQAALARGDLARLGLHEASADSLHQDGQFEGLFRLLRASVLELIGPSPASWPSSPYWPAAFASLFSEPMLHAMFGPEATQHANPGSYPGYFQRAFERGLADIETNYFVRHVFLGDYVDGCAPDYLSAAGKRLEIDLIEGPLEAVGSLDRFDLISLSNVFDWSSDALVATWAGLLRSAKPGAGVVIRQLNNRRNVRAPFLPYFQFDHALGKHLQAVDRSLFYDRFEAGFRA